MPRRNAKEITGPADDVEPGNTGGPFRFLELPPEIRRIIYQCIFDEVEGAIDVTFTDSPEDWGSTKSRPKTRPAPRGPLQDGDPFPLGVLRASSFVYQESINVLYSQVDFDLLVSGAGEQYITQFPVSDWNRHPIVQPTIPWTRITNLNSNTAMFATRNIMTDGAVFMLAGPRWNDISMVGSYLECFFLHGLECLKRFNVTLEVPYRTSSCAADLSEFFATMINKQRQPSGWAAVLASNEWGQALIKSARELKKTARELAGRPSHFARTVALTIMVDTWKGIFGMEVRFEDILKAVERFEAARDIVARVG